VSANNPTINFTLGSELVNIFRQQAPPLPIVTATAPPHDILTLLHPSRVPGRDMPIEEFCATHDLGPTILEKLQENFFMHARVLRFLTIQELKDMNFRLGEIASLRDAVEGWSAPKSE
jgi:hypothetical protein